MGLSLKKTASHLVKLSAPHQTKRPKETVCMKFSKAAIHRKNHGLPALKFEDEKLNSLGFLVAQLLESGHHG